MLAWLKGDVLDVLFGFGFRLGDRNHVGGKIDGLRYGSHRGHGAMAVEPVPQPNSSTFILGLKVVSRDLQVSSGKRLHLRSAVWHNRRQLCPKI
jgi:hypothetical protein